MCEKRCKTCRFWEDERCCQYLDGQRGTCTSDDAHNTCGYLTPSSHFGCIHWQQREPDLRERLAEYVYYYACCGLEPYSEIGDAAKRAYLGHGDKIITIFEEYQKGKENG